MNWRCRHNIMYSITYGLVEEKYEYGDLVRTSYGIVVYANRENDGLSTIISSVRDISPNKHKIMDLVDECNRNQLSPIHFMDVIEDFLAE